MHDKDTRDATIIGAGIGGLVCGCYLARAGKKVLIAEQHHKPGGYCTSFKRQGFIFDAAAHSLGGFKYGNFGKIFDDLELNKKVRMKQIDPSNIIITPDYRVSFWADLDRTIEDLQISFPNESNSIRNFFCFLLKSDSKSSTPAMKSWTFKDLLDKYFNDDKLKAILCFPLLGNGGLPPSLMSAFIGAKMFREYLLDGGYYPEGGMQTLSDALAERFKEFGGELRLSSLVTKIKTKDNRVTGIILEKGDFVPSRYVISNCDARQTFLSLLDRRIISQDFLNKINTMLPSLSAFILYLGVNDSLYDSLKPGSNIWIAPQYNLDSAYISTQKGHCEEIGGYLLHISLNRNTLLALMNAPFKTKGYWIKNKRKISESFVERISSDVIPGLSNHITYHDAATPYTLYRYTLNYKGAAFGWACIPSQLALTDFRKPSFVQGLYLAGHWATKGLGIPGVVYVGYDTAKMILRKDHIKDVTKITL